MNQSEWVLHFSDLIDLIEDDWGIQFPLAPINIYLFILGTLKANKFMSRNIHLNL